MEGLSTAIPVRTPSSTQTLYACIAGTQKHIEREYQVGSCVQPNFSINAKDQRIDSYSVPSPSASGTDKPKVSLTNKESMSMCNICNRQFRNKAALRKHEKHSQKHRTLPKATRSISSSIPKAPATSLNCKEGIVAASETESGRAIANENDNIDEPLTDLMDQPCPHLLSRLGLHAPQTSFLQGNLDTDIGLTGALVAQTLYKLSVGHWVLPFSKTDPGDAKADHPVASVSVEHQKKNTNFRSYKLVVPGVPAPWSSIPSSKRDVVLKALQTQCHPIECLAGERYWTQTPSPVDIDMTIKCSACGGKESP